jgi:ribokinase
MFDVITIGSSLIDIFVKSDDFELKKMDHGVLLCQTLGEKVEVNELVLRTGGGGSNTAVGFARMGFASGVVTETGRDLWADLVMSELHKEFVNTNMVIREKQEQTGGSVILVSNDGGRTVMVYRGAASQLDPHDIQEKYFSQAKWVHLSSIAGRLPTLKKLFSIVDDQKNLRLSWNPGKQELSLLSEGKISLSEDQLDILFVNEEEWGMLDNLQQQLQAIIRQIVVTNGKKGGRVFWQNEWHDYRPSQVESVDDTGAGDAFAVGYVSAVLYEQDLKTSIDWGVSNAASVVGHIGAKPGLLRKSELNNKVSSQK